MESHIAVAWAAQQVVLRQLESVEHADREHSQQILANTWTRDQALNVAIGKATHWSGEAIRRESGCHLIRLTVRGG